MSSITDEKPSTDNDATDEPQLAEDRSENSDLTEEIESLDELFKDRYTENDEGYMKLKSTPLSSPPVVHPWNVRPKHSFNKRWNRGRGGQRWNESNRESSRYRESGGWSWRDNNSPGWYQQSYGGSGYRDRDRHRSYRDREEHSSEGYRKYSKSYEGSARY